MNTPNIETELKRLDKMYAYGHMTGNKSMINKAETGIDNVFNSIEHNQFDDLSHAANMILDSYGYEDNLPYHEGWE